MKKIFAISFLSVFAVVGLARADYYGFYASGTDATQNYNLASVNYVQGRYDSAVDTAKGLVVKSDKKTTVAGGSRSSGFAGSDFNAPTIKYMEDSIAEAVAGVDTSGLVEKTQIVTSAEGQAVSAAGEEVPVSIYSAAVQAGGIDVQESMDSEVASVNTVAEHFVPNVAKYYDYTGGNDGSDNLEPGDYVLTVTVDQSGNKVYVWRAMNISASRTTVSGYVGPS